MPNSQFDYARGVEEAARYGSAAGVARGGAPVVADGGGVQEEAAEVGEAGVVCSWSMSLRGGGWLFPVDWG
eukprot:1109643-Alexandrium_andersonii.AAC.1